MTSNDDLKTKVLEQLEFYFGDINLPRDKFFQTKMKEDDGWIDMDTLLNCVRLAKLTLDKTVIAEAVKESSSPIVAINEDGTKIRRNPENPLPENSLEYWQKIKHRTVYMKGFKQDSTLDEIREWAKQYGNLDNVLMRKAKPGNFFKGSCFVTYKTREDAEKAQKGVEKFGEVDLTKMMQDDYWSQKNREAKEKRAAEKALKSSKNTKEKKETKVAGSEVNFTKGLILEASGFPLEVTVNQLKEFFAAFGAVGYVVTAEKEGDPAKIRFSGAEGGAKAAWDKAQSSAPEGKVMFGEKEITAKVLDGDDEAAFWEEFNQTKKNKFDRSKSSRRGGGRGRGRGGHRGHRDDRKREHPGDGARGDEPKAKRIVFDDDENAAPKAEPAEQKPEPAEQKTEPAVSNEA
ncbi:unnamed protein product, partial [Mesorhabditis spiculigera]